MNGRESRRRIPIAKKNSDEWDEPKRERLQARLDKRIKQFATHRTGRLLLIRPHGASGSHGVFVLLGWTKKSNFVRPFMRKNNPRMELWENDPMNFDAILFGSQGVIEVPWTIIALYGKFIS